MMFAFQLLQRKYKFAGKRKRSWRVRHNKCWEKW